MRTNSYKNIFLRLLKTTRIPFHKTSHHLKFFTKFLAKNSEFAPCHHKFHNRTTYEMISSLRTKYWMINSLESGATLREIYNHTHHFPVFLIKLPSNQHIKPWINCTFTMLPLEKYLIFSFFSSKTISFITLHILIVLLLWDTGLTTIKIWKNRWIVSNCKRVVFYR